MSEDQWMEIAARIVPEGLVDLDGSVFDATDVGSGAWLGHSDLNGWRLPSTSVWPKLETDAVMIGVRVDTADINHSAIAIRLVALAIERSVTPVIFSTLPVSGFESFGFRVERIGGATPEEISACELELMQFWGIEIVIGVRDILKMA